MLTGAQMRERIGLTRATVDKRRTEGKLLALDFGTKRGVRYPAWQGDLVQNVDARATYEQVLRELGGEGAWSRYRPLSRAVKTCALSVGDRPPTFEGERMMPRIFSVHFESRLRIDGNSRRRFARLWVAHFERFERIEQDSRYDPAASIA